jgi:hypothetical protein
MLFQFFLGFSLCCWERTPEKSSIGPTRDQLPPAVINSGSSMGGNTDGPDGTVAGLIVDIINTVLVQSPKYATNYIQVRQALRMNSAPADTYLDSGCP